MYFIFIVPNVFQDREFYNNCQLNILNYQKCPNFSESIFIIIYETKEFIVLKHVSKIDNKKILLV